jgi:hypothetical protein
MAVVQMYDRETANLPHSRLALGWAQPLPLALFGQDAFGKVHPLFQLTDALLQFIELAESGLQVFQRLALLALRLVATLASREALRPKTKPDGE